MKPDDDACYQALLSHDPRFDGAFFVGVASTGIYCRSVCTARTPLRKNCTFYANAASAERAGYRPCLRCRPELAPGHSRVDARSIVASSLATRLERGDLAEFTVSELAAEVGISERHLRRVSLEEFGVTPIELAQTYRLHLAKRLLTDSDLTVTQVAFASGFSSIRRFNALFKERYRLNPTGLRRKAGLRPADAALRCSLAYRPPYDWHGMLKFLSPRAIPGVERVGDAYHRTVKIGAACGWVSVTNDPGHYCLVAEVSQSLIPVVSQVLARLKHLFDLSCDPARIDGHLGTLAQSQPGARVPGAFDGFEMAIRAICGQQVTVRGATTLAGRIAQSFGQPVSDCPVDGLSLTWPDAAKLACVEPEKLAACGLVKRRVATIGELARAAAAGAVRLEAGVDVERTITLLKAIPGIGEWTAQYVAMRALRWPDAFPASDLGILKALGAQSESEALKRAEQWRPWRAYAAIHLWRSLETLK